MNYEASYFPSALHILAPRHRAPLWHSSALP
jgi:hypothetical protein